MVSYSLMLQSNFINALKFAQGRFQSRMEANIFVEILILEFILSKWKLKPK